MTATYMFLPLKRWKIRKHFEMNKLKTYISSNNKLYEYLKKRVRKSKTSKCNNSYRILHN